MALLWAASIVFFWNVLFGGESFYFRDTTSYYLPQAHVTMAALREGRLPHWEPTIGHGYPFQADPHSMVFYPLTVIFLLLPFARAYNLFVAIHVPLGGTFLYALLRRWDLSKPASALGAVTLMFCGYTISTTCLTTLLRGTIWAPLALLAYDPFVTQRRKRALLTTALVLAIQGSGTDPQYVLFTAILLLAYPWLRPGADRGGWRQHLGGLTLAGMLAMALLSYQYLPLGQLILNSDRTAGVASGEATDYGQDLYNLYNAVLPVPFPDPASPYYLSSFRGAEVPFYPDIYWGFPIFGLVLASLAWAARRKEGAGDSPFGVPALTAAGISVASIAVAISALPFFTILTTLVPPLKLFRYPGKYFLMAGVTMAISAALGLEGVLQRRPAVEATFRRALLGFVGLMLFAMAVLAVTGHAIPHHFMTWRFEVTGSEVGVLFGKMKAAWFVNLAFAAALVVVLLILLERARREQMDWGRAVLLASVLIAGDLMWNTRQGFPTAPDDTVMLAPKTAPLMGRMTPTNPPPRFIGYSPDTVKMDAERTSFAFMMLQVPLLTHLRSAMVGCGMLMSTMSVRLSSARDLMDLFWPADRKERHEMARAAGVRYLVRLKTASAAEDAAKIVGSAGPVIVQEIDGPITPHAFIATRAMPPVSDRKIPDRGDIKTIPSNVVYIPLPGEESVLEPKAVRYCRIVGYSHEQVEIEFDLEGSGLLVLLDAPYPAWHAYVDGKERPIVRAAGVFRGVRVQQGEKRLVMRYEPDAFRTGAAVSLLSLSLLTAAMFWMARREKASA